MKKPGSVMRKSKDLRKKNKRKLLALMISRKSQVRNPRNKKISRKKENLQFNNKLHRRSLTKMMRAVPQTAKEVMSGSLLTTSISTWINYMK